MLYYFGERHLRKQRNQTATVPIKDPQNFIDLDFVFPSSISYLVAQNEILHAEAPALRLNFSNSEIRIIQNLCIGRKHHEITLLPISSPPNFSQVLLMFPLPDLRPLQLLNDRHQHGRRIPTQQPKLIFNIVPERNERNILKHLIEVIFLHVEPVVCFDFGHKIFFVFRFILG